MKGSGFPGGDLTVDQQRAILQSRVIEKMRDGWHVVYQTDTTADLVRPKRFNWPLAIFAGILTLAILFAGYVIEYLLASGESQRLEVLPSGEVTVTKGSHGRFFRA